MTLGVTDGVWDDVLLEVTDGVGEAVDEGVGDTVGVGLGGGGVGVALVMVAGFTCSVPCRSMEAKNSRPSRVAPPKSA